MKAKKLKAYCKTHNVKLVATSPLTLDCPKRKKILSQGEDLEICEFECREIT